MPSLKITYGNPAVAEDERYAFHDEGVVHYGSSTEPEAGAAPSKFTQTFKLKLRFFESSFADNEARWSRLRQTMRNNPRGILTITDETGGVIEEATVKFAGQDGDAEWGQFRREITLSFVSVESLGIDNDFSATYTPAGKTAVRLPNVAVLTGAVKSNRYSTHSNLRSESVESITLSGRWSPGNGLSDVEKRDALLKLQEAIKSVAKCPEGTLAYGALRKTMAVESATADIGDGHESLNWTLNCFQRAFPEGTYAEADYTMERSEDREENRATVTVSGKVIADTEAQARKEAERIRKLYARGRTWVSGQTTKRQVDGSDGTDACIELSFNWRFRELTDLVSWKLKVSIGTDTRTGDVTTTYSGSVVAGTAASALEKARELGAAHEATTQILMAKSEETSTCTIGTGGQEFVALSFSYTYLGKTSVVFAEIQTDNATDFFGPNNTTVSGSVTALTADEALNFARRFMLSGVILLAQRESDGSMVKGNSLSHFIRVDFSYSYARQNTATTASYGREEAHDYAERTTTVTISGTAYGYSEDQCDNLINSFARSPGAKFTKLRDARTSEWKTDGGSDVLLARAFSVGWTGPISATDADSIDIIEATYTVTRRYGIWKSVIDEIPFGKPYVQENVALTCGSVSVTGSVTAVKLDTGLKWAREKKRYAIGHEEEPEEAVQYIFPPRKAGDADVKQHAITFTYAAKDENGVWKKPPP